MKIERLVSRYLSANCYLISEAGHVLVIDPCERELLEPTLSGRMPDFALLTHEHADHIIGVNYLRNNLGVRVICSEKCAVHLPNPRMNYSYYYETTKKLMSFLMEDDSSTMEPFSCISDSVFSEDTVLEWQGHRILAKLTPGHSQGSVCYLFDGAVLFAGDTIFRSAPTITKFKGGSLAELREFALPWLRMLPGDIEVYPGHFENFSLSEWSGLKG